MQMLIAGFGGQGVLFLGKVIATVGMLEDKYVTFSPSYGPEMRGGTANCSVCIDEEEIGSPVVNNPKTLIALNTPSYNKFIDLVKENSNVIIDNSLVDISNNNINNNINILSIPATKIATDNNLNGLANIIILGYLLKINKFTSLDSLKNALTKCIPKSKNHMLLPNIKALEIGYNYN